ncbi:MAG: hypothetical protein R3C44_22980 [Chloroflexota bacterium]
METDENYARRAVVKEWLRGRDWDPDVVFPDNPDIIPARMNGLNRM